MESRIKVFEVSEEVWRKVNDEIERIIFEKKNDGTWIYHAPNAQDHTEKQLEVILKKLKELNSKEVI